VRARGAYGALLEADGWTTDTFTRQHRGPLVETTNAIWAAYDGIAVVGELFEQITDYDR
jgi:phage tail protein X